MTQEMAVKIWVDGAIDALDTCDKLFKSKKYHHALFFCHLAVEKALKAKYALGHSDMPPYTHHLVLLASKVDTKLTEEQQIFLPEINTFNIAARYDEEKLNLYKKATQTYAQEWMGHTSEILKTLL